MNENLFNVLILVIPILGAIITGFVIPLLKAKLGTEKLATITTWVTYAVKCAEMIFLGDKQGEEKKQYVIDFLTNMFNKKKVVITEEQLEVLIEAAVKELNLAKGE
jgi:LL-H family phage holin